MQIVSLPNSPDRPTLKHVALADSSSADTIFTAIGDGSTELNQPTGVAVDPLENILVADTGNNVVRVIPTAANSLYGFSMQADAIYTVAGGATQVCSGALDTEGDGCPELKTTFSSPGAVVVDPNGNVLITDTFDNLLRVVATRSGVFYGVNMVAGDVYSVAGGGTYGGTCAQATDGYGDGCPPTMADLSDPQGLSVDSAGDIIIADTGNNLIREIPATSGTRYGIQMTADLIYTVSGLSPTGCNYQNYGDGCPANGGYSNDVPTGVALDAAHNIIFADENNSRLVVVPEQSGNYYGRSMTAGYQYNVGIPFGNCTVSDGSPCLASAGLNNFDPGYVTVDPQTGDLLVTGPYDSQIWVFATSTAPFDGIAMTAGYVYLLAGTGTSGFSGDGGPAPQAELSSPNGLALDLSGGLLFADSGNNRIREITSLAGAPLSGDGIGTGVVTLVHNPTCDTPNPVNCASGDFWHSFTDASMPGRGPGLGLTRTYNSISASSDGMFGYGWSSSYGAHLNTNPDGSVTIIAEDGSGFTAPSSSSGTFTVPSWADSTLVHNSDGSWTMVRHQTQTLDFDSGGRLAKIVDLNGYATTLSYSTGGQLQSVTDAPGRSITFSFGSNGLVSQIGTPDGSTIQYGYDPAGELTSVTDPMGRVTSFTYDVNHLLLTMTDPNGGVLTNVYDGQPRVISQTDPAGLKTLFSYSGDNYSILGGSTTITDSHGNVVVERYANGALVSVTKGVGTPNPSTWRYSYDPTSLGRTTATDPNGDTTRSTYDAQGNLLSTVDPLGNATTLTYNAFDEPLIVTDPMGIATTYSYDASGNVQTKTVAGTGGSPVATTSYTYGDSAHPGDVTQVEDPDGHASDYTYDAYGDVASVTTHPTPTFSDVTEYVYDVMGRKLCQASPNATAAGVRCPNPGQQVVAGTTTWSYDSDSEVTATTDPLGHQTSHLYDPTGNAIQSTDPVGNVTRTSYDLDKRPTTVTQGFGTSASSTTSSVYDLVPVATPTASDPCNAALNVAGDAVTYCTETINGLSNATVSYYDAQNRLIDQAPPAPLGATSYTYDASGNQTTVQSPGGLSTNAYDADNRLVSSVYSNAASGYAQAPNVTFAYDADGHRVKMTDGTGTTTYSYDPLGRLASTSGSDGTVSYTRDLDGNVTVLGYPNGLGVTRTYDGAGQWSSVTDWEGHTTSFSYDRDGNLTSEAFPNGVTSTQTFDASNDLSTISDSSSAYPNLATFNYANPPRTSDNQVAAEADSGSAVGSTGNGTYGYDPLTRLQSDRAGSYGYDTAGDLTQLSNGTTQNFNAASELTSSKPAIGYGGSTTANYTIVTTQATTSSQTFSLAPGIAANDQIVIGVVEDSGQSASIAGYVQVGSWSGGSGAKIQVFRRTAAGGEASASITWAATNDVHAVEVEGTFFRGVDPNNPIDVSQSGTSSGTQNLNVPGVTTSLGGDELVLLTGGLNDTSNANWLPPSGMNVQAESDTAQATESIFNQRAPNPGPTGDRSVVLNPAGASVALITQVGALLALRPAVTSYTFDALGDRTATSFPWGTSYIGYDQTGHIVTDASTKYSYDGDGLRRLKTDSLGDTVSYSWDIGGGQPEMITGKSSLGFVPNYVFGPGGLPLEQLQTPSVQYLGSSSGYNAVAATQSSPDTITDNVSAVNGTSGEYELALVAITEDSTMTASVVLNTFTTCPSVGSWQQAGGAKLQIFNCGVGGPNSTGGTLSLTFSTSQSADTHTIGVLYSVFQSADPMTPVDATSGSGSSSGSVTTPSVTTTEPGDDLALFESALNAPTSSGWTPSAGLHQDTSFTSAALVAFGVADGRQALAGPSGSKSATYNGTAVGATLAGALIAIRPQSPLYFLHDQLGSTRVLVDQGGTVQATYAYSPYGAISYEFIPSGNVVNPYTFAGGYADPESTLMYLVHRYYDPMTGQFLSVDPALDATGQPYAYSSDDPVNETDPTGLYGYKYTFDLGHGNSPENYLADLQYDINDVFPFGVQTTRGQWVGAEQGGLQCGQEYLINTFGYHNSVRVTSLTDTSLTFESLPGHAEGAGNFITFSFFYGAQTGDTYFRVQATGPTQWFDHIPLVEGSRQNLAHAMWADLASNLQSFIPNQA